MNLKHTCTVRSYRAVNTFRHLISYTQITTLFPKNRKKISQMNTPGRTCKFVLLKLLEYRVTTLI